MSCNKNISKRTVAILVRVWHRDTDKEESTFLFFGSQSTYAKQYTHGLRDSDLSSLLLCRNTAESLRPGINALSFSQHLSLLVIGLQGLIFHQITVVCDCIAGDFKSRVMCSAFTNTTSLHRCFDIIHILMYTVYTSMEIPQLSSFWFDHLYIPD